MSESLNVMVSQSLIDYKVQKDSASIVSNGIRIAGMDIKEGLKGIAISNEQIAKAIETSATLKATAILKTCHLIENGIQSIVDEMRRKTYMEEHYLLLDRIDSLEDKIIAKGGNLEEIYDSYQTKFTAPITISISEILTMISCLEDIEWFKIVASTYKVNPWDVFINITETCEKTYIFRGVSVAFYKKPHMLEVWNKDDTVEGYRISKTEYKNCIPIYYFGEKDRIKSSFTDGYGYYIEEMFFESHYDDNPKEYVLGVKARYDKESLLSTFELESVNEFYAEINRINADIMLENLRLLHTELMDSYRKMKCK